MSRKVLFEIKQNGVALPILGGTVTLREQAQSRASLQLDPTATAAITLNLADAFDLYLVYYKSNGDPVRTLVMQSAVAQAAKYDRAFEGSSGPNPGADRRSRQLILADKLSAFADYAPGELVTHEATDTRQELNYIAAQVGAAGIRTNIPNASILRIDYTREGGYWSPILPWVSPFEPQILVDPSSAQISIWDTTQYHGDMPRSTRKLTLADYNPASLSVDLRPVVTQYKVIWLDFSGEGGRKPILLGTRTNEEVVIEDDGSKTLTWTKEADLNDDADNPTIVTRTVTVGDGMTRTNGATRIAESETTYQWEADYTRLFKKTTVNKATVGLPYMGEDYRTIETITETLTYGDHPTVPNRKVLVEAKTITTGLYIWTYTTNDPLGTDGTFTATGCRLADYSGTIDTSASSTQRFAEAQLSTDVTRYVQTKGGREVIVHRSITDDLRHKEVYNNTHTEIGDNSITPTGKLQVEYVGTAGRRAQVVDASQIGRAFGVDIATRKLARSGTAVKGIRLTLTRPDYSEFRFGYIIELDTDAPYGLSGKYLCTEVNFTISAQTPTQPSVVQELTLARIW